ncbi:MAG: peptidylprolyl isomerase, partial [Nitrospirota bacterium]
EELKGYYDNNRQAFAVAEQLRLSIIKTPNIEEAKKIKKEIEKGAAFEGMANKYPAGHTGPGEGETGWITLDTFPADMAKAIRKIKAGTAGGPIKGREGYYIIKVLEKKEKKVQSFDEARENIRNILMQQKARDKFRAWLQDTRKNAKIEILQKG